MAALGLPSLPSLGLSGGSSGVGPTNAGLDTGGLAGLIGLDGSGWTVSTGGGTATGGTSGGGGAGASAAGGALGTLKTMPWGLLIGAALLGVILWKRV